jgi:1-acyl-sn-glycerol-3-phosphate acyltransferase
MWNAVIDGAQPEFWPPRPNRFWKAALAPLRRYYLRRYYGITQVAVEGAEPLLARLGPADGVLLAPNHSHDSDPHVMMEVGRRAHRPFAFMAAWQIFRTHWGLDGWVLQRMGAFSVDREGCDRRAIRQAVEFLSSGHALVVFPEGEIYHLNDRLTPLLEGVAFMALTAQRELDKSGSGARVWVVPTAIRYRYLDDVTPKLEAAVAALESRLFWKPRPGSSLHERIIQVGEVLLTIKEKEKLGRVCEGEGDLRTRIARLAETLLQRLETEHLKKTPSADTVPLRVKALRRHLLSVWADENADPAARQQARAALDDVQLVLQLYSYPGDYLTEKPSVERMAETIEKFEEDIYGAARPKGRRRARVLLGEPIDLKQIAAERARTAAHDVTVRLEETIQGMMKEGA